MLTVGQSAPAFVLPDETGKSVSLSDFQGKKVVLFFYPKDDTPGCTRESIGFTQAKADFEAAGAVVLGVSKDSVKSHGAFCTKHALTVTLLSDESLDMIKAYGVWQEKTNYGKTSMGIVRTTVLLDEKGQFLKVWSSVKVDGHVEAVLAEVKRHA
ncbi:MAG: thioredoxin-dependent thiol peroxidase [Candidatus Margulisiibacteriota bacterium]